MTFSRKMYIKSSNRKNSYVLLQTWAMKTAIYYYVCSRLKSELEPREINILAWNFKYNGFTNFSRGF